MFSINNYEYDCTKKCKSLEHGKAINNALTKKSVSDLKLAAFIAKTCRNFAEILDYEGRSALQMASSVGRYAIAEWLLNQGASINQKDYESSHTALHRAIYYGSINVAALLLRYGAMVDITDADFRCPLQHCCRRKSATNQIVRNEIVVWGNNKNYNLGIGNEQGKYLPQYIEDFRKREIFVKDASIGQYHSLFLSEKGEVYAVGHGKGGRLGIGNENTLVTPKKVALALKNADEKVIAVSAGKYHSLALTDNDLIYSTGINSHLQLGVKPPPEKLLTFREISGLTKVAGKCLKGVAAHDYYSLAYNDSEIYVWGTNGGQIGIRNETESILLIQELGINDHKIKSFGSNNAAIACYTTNKFLYIFHKFKTRSVKSPGLEAITKIVVIGGEFQSPKIVGANLSSPLRILVLTDSGSLFVWYEDIQKYVRCIFPMARDFPIDKIERSSKKLLFLSDGDVYTGTMTKFNSQQIEFGDYKETYNKKDICNESKVKIELKRVPNISRASNLFGDETGENFAALLENPRTWLDITPWRNDVPDMSRLLDEADDSDAIHDVVFHVDDRKFIAHKFIIQSRAPGIGALIKPGKDKNVYLKIDRLTSDIFESFLRFIYTNECKTLDEICEMLEPLDKKDALNTFRNFLKVFQIKDYPIESTRRDRAFPSFNRLAHPQLFDVTIKCSNNEEIRAHKCVLVSRLDYFAMMFQHTWSESSTINLNSIPLEYLQPAIDYLYSSDFDRLFLNQNYSENYIFHMLTICDQFFIEQLRYNFEILVLKRLSLKNCGEILEFACSFNCDQLVESCIEYICLNIDRVLENGSILNLDDSILSRINLKYCSMFPEVGYRMITPYADAVDDDMLDCFVDDFTVDLESKANGEAVEKSNIKKTKFKQNKSVLERRQYEKDAISMIKDISIEDDDKQKSLNRSRLISETQELSDKLQSESVSWTKVKVDKIKKPIISLKVNEILQNEEKDTNKFTNLNDILTKTTVKSPPPVAILSSPVIEPQSPVENNRSSINLGDFTPIKSTKMSQKQRKRLSSENQQTQKLISPPIAIPSQENRHEPITSPGSVWGSNSLSSIANIMKSGRDGISSTSPVEIRTPLSHPGIQYSPSPSPQQKSNIKHDIFSIQRDEKAQKVYYDKMKSKSLILTQIEERAIEELRNFYNVDNVFDEAITIERKSKITVNFAVWDLQNH